MAAIDADERSDRAISLAAGLGPNFISQMRGSKSATAKKPNIEYVKRIAAVLGKELAAIIGPNDADAEQQLRNALLAMGADKSELDVLTGIVTSYLKRGAVEQPSQSPADGLSQPASRRRATEPSR